MCYKYNCVDFVKTLEIKHDAGIQFESIKNDAAAQTNQFLAKRHVCIQFDSHKKVNAETETHPEIFNYLGSRKDFSAQFPECLHIPARVIDVQKDHPV